MIDLRVFSFASLSGILFAVVVTSCTSDSLPGEDTGVVTTGNDSAGDFPADAVLAEHNRARADVSSPPLTWNESLAQSSQTWADGCQISHATDRNIDGQVFGENIAAGTFGFSVEDLGKMWIDEEIEFWSCPNNTCSKEPCGHYTQIIWKDTTEVGCGAAVCGNQHFLVCRYLPAGNVVGQRPIPVNNCSN